VLSAQVFDQRKFTKKKDQGFLGVINALVGTVLDLSKPTIQSYMVFDLKKSNSKDVVKGSIGLLFSSDLNGFGQHSAHVELSTTLLAADTATQSPIVPHNPEPGSSESSSRSDRSSPLESSVLLPAPETSETLPLG
jgi:E3 ubiquitin-protein ligase NEDD4